MESKLSNIFEELKTKYNLSVRESAPDEPELKATIESFRDLLKELQQASYVHLADLTAYDESPATPRFYVVYELISLQDKKRCSVIVPLNDADPKIPTIIDLWKGADWLERETYDMFGIVFEGHPDLRRILLPNSFKGFPLRKDFVVDYRQEFDKKLVEEGLFDPFGATVVRGKSE